MGQFDVHRLSGGDLVVDCQSDLLSHLSTRVVVPLLPADEVPVRAARLNPILGVNGEDRVLFTQFMAAVPRSELGQTVASLADRSLEITSAIDVLVSGV